MLRSCLLSSFIIYLLIVKSYGDSLGVFDDSVLFDVSWPGLLPEDSPLTIEKARGEGVDITDDDSDPFIMTTLRNEKYQCMYVPERADESDSDATTSDADAIVLLTPLFSLGQCLYRVESYWSYELCLGKHLRQYHEERGPGQTIKVTEYYLGKVGVLEESTNLLNVEEPINKEGTEGEEELEDLEVDRRTENFPTWHYDGNEYPYHAVEMRGGTPCDLKHNEPRFTRLLFICLEDVVAELIYLKEVTTCEYEAVVATSALCFNKVYKVHQEQAYNIKCFALDDTSAQPASLVSHLKSLSLTAVKERGKHAGQQEQSQHPVDLDIPLKTLFTAAPQGPMEADPKLVQQFLSGEYCITGGTGWWKHEFCYEKHVKQFHRDAHGKTDVLLGRWNKQRHTSWISENTKKLSTTQVVHYYTGGDVCDITKQPRECQVKIKCVKSMLQTQISIFIQEPSTCKYILTVETSFLCPLIENADEHGMLRS